MNTNDTGISRRVVVFCKYPEPGRVKTRLAQSIGDVRAARIARELLELTLSRLASLKTRGTEVVVFFDPASRHEEFRQWLGQDAALRPQPDGDLGRRVAAAFCVKDGEPTNTIILGSDCPGISSDIVEQAFARIDNQRMVFGPTTDGGFYLMGARAIPDGFFRNIRWSSAVTLKELESRADAAGFTLARLPELFDVDTYSDLLRWRAESPGSTT